MDSSFMTARCTLGTAVLAAAAACVGSSAAPEPAAAAAAAEGSAGGSPLQALDGSVDPLRNRFNDARGKLRFIAVLSPT